jgi:hypothetical protein
MIGVAARHAGEERHARVVGMGGRGDEEKCRDDDTHLDQTRHTAHACVKGVARLAAAPIRTPVIR